MMRYPNAWLCICLNILFGGAVIQREAETKIEPMNAGVVSEAAVKADREYRRAVQQPRWIRGSEYEIPSEYWNDTLKQMNPIKIYNHMLNIVIVLKQQNGVEEGIYVRTPLTSYAAGPDGVKRKDGFMFYGPEQGNIINYQRILGLK